jgi:8-oxo-dGTP pyrophosphatase MutT (NUDIX family)
MFEPQKIFIGIIDFFAILLPGALFTLLIRDEAARRFFDAGYYYPDGPKGWVIFGFASYLLGHFIFLIGSDLDKVYDLLRKPTYQEQVKRLAEGKRLSFPLFRYLSWVFFTKKDSDSAVTKAVQIKNFYLNPIDASESINAFQWCKARLALEQPEASAAVQRFEADSKFFRSLVILCLLVFVLAPLDLITHADKVPWIAVPVLVLAFWRYIDQRMKATNQAYWYVITLEGKPDSKLRRRTLSVGPSHAGGVVFRSGTSGVEYLLVEAQDGSWELPKGSIKQPESIRQAVVREVREQSGVWARIKSPSPLMRVSLPVDGAIVPVEFYLMESVEGRLDRRFAELEFLYLKFRGRLDESKRRQNKWLGFEAAKAAATHAESKKIFELAQQARSHDY